MKNQTLPAHSWPIRECGDDGARHWRQTQTRTGQHPSALGSSQSRFLPDPEQMETVGPSPRHHHSVFTSVTMTYTDALLRVAAWESGCEQSFPLTCFIVASTSVDALHASWTCRSKFSWLYQLSNVELYAEVSFEWPKCFGQGRKNNITALWFLPFCKTIQTPSYLCKNALKWFWSGTNCTHFLSSLPQFDLRYARHAASRCQEQS